MRTRISLKYLAERERLRSELAAQWATAAAAKDETTVAAFWLRVANEAALAQHIIETAADRHEALVFCDRLLQVLEMKCAWTDSEMERAAMKMMSMDLRLDIDLLRLGASSLADC